jgi:hypothetical protein
MNDLELARTRLKEQGLSFCIVKHNKILFEGMSAGIKDILYIVSNEDIRDSSVADKIIGKAVALLLVKSKIKAAFALNINQSALDTLSLNKIEAKYENLMNRLDSMCQFEMAVKDINDPKKALETLSIFG